MHTYWGGEPDVEEKEDVLASVLTSLLRIMIMEKIIGKRHDKSGRLISLNWSKDC